MGAEIDGVNSDTTVELAGSCSKVGHLMVSGTL